MINLRKEDGVDCAVGEQLWSRINEAVNKH